MLKHSPVSSEFQHSPSLCSVARHHLYLWLVITGNALQERADGKQEPEEENVAGSGAEDLVEGFAIKSLELAEGAEMKNEVDKHEGIADGGERIEEQSGEGKEGRNDAEPKIEVEADLFTFFLPLPFA